MRGFGGSKNGADDGMFSEFSWDGMDLDMCVCICKSDLVMYNICA